MLRLKQKGQSSFEFLLVTLFIIFISLLVLNSWFSISDETQVIVLLKTKIVERLNAEDDFYTLRKIEVVDNQDPTSLELKVFITPAVTVELERDLQLLADGIEDHTKYTAISLDIQ